jgi:hypothetical protein
VVPVDVVPVDVVATEDVPVEVVATDVEATDVVGCVVVVGVVGVELPQLAAAIQQTIALTVATTRPTDTANRFSLRCDITFRPEGALVSRPCNLCQHYISPSIDRSGGNSVRRAHKCTSVSGDRAS